MAGWDFKELKNVSTSRSLSYQTAESLKALTFPCKIVKFRVGKRLSRLDLANSWCKLVAGKVGLWLSEECCRSLDLIVATHKFKGWVVFWLGRIIWKVQICEVLSRRKTKTGPTDGRIRDRQSWKNIWFTWCLQCRNQGWPCDALGQTREGN